MISYGIQTTLEQCNGNTFSSLNRFVSKLFVLPVLSKTYSTILDSSLLRKEGEFLNKTNKRKDCSQATSSFDGLPFVDIEHSNTDSKKIPNLYDPQYKITTNF